MAIARAAQREHIFTVTELTRNVKGMLESAFHAVWVEGELSGGKVAASGHFYGTLKDERAQVDVVMWKGQRAKLGFELENGTQYLCLGNVSVYEARGTYQLVLQKVEPAGIGALQLQFEQLKKRLEAEGLFEEGRKQALPAFPKRIGVVTSAGSAAIRDILSVLTRRFAGLEILIHDTLVQGDKAPEQIVAAIDALDRLGACDVLIVGRGGGSLEDLWAFNTEPVARAIYGARTPIISAVGHEVDYTIADFVADVRAPTPSAAAELVVQERQAVLNRVADHRRRLTAALRSRCDRLAQRVSSLRERYGFQRPADLVAQRTQRVDDLTQSLGRGIGRRAEYAGRALDHARQKLALLAPSERLARRTERLAALRARLRACSPGRRVPALGQLQRAVRDRLMRAAGAALARQEARFGQAVKQLDALSPLRVLARGYSVATVAATGAVVADATTVSPGDAVSVRLHRGRLACRVTAVEETVSDG